MTITNSFRQAVASGNVKGIRIMMKDSLLVDRSFDEFAEMSSFASGVEGLYDAHDGGEFITDSSAWDDDYMSKVRVEVVRNFSHERLAHLKEIIRKLHPFTPPSKSQTSPSHQQSPRSQERTYQEQKQYDKRNGLYRGEKIALGAAGGAVVGGVVAAVAYPVAVPASLIIIGGVAVGAMVGGVAVAVATGGKK